MLVGKKIECFISLGRGYLERLGKKIEKKGM